MNTETAGHDSIRLIVKRQEGPNAKPHWEEFSVAHQPHMNVVSALMEIRKNPVNAQGKPPPWFGKAYALKRFVEPAP